MSCDSDNCKDCNPTDAEQSARGIAEKIVRGPGWADKYFSVQNDGLHWDILIGMIAAALTAYGEAEYQRGKNQEYAVVLNEWAKANLNAVSNARKEADAEGYRRGVEDCILQMHIEVQTLKELSMRNGLQPLESELRGRIEKLRELQRGTGGGK